ncbi:transcriptional regulator GutM [Selenomonas sputigena]|uniref:Transcriptional regulator GutM n=1 Tax=Selenomonas sputigena TaxID=69823 RepID=A0ABV3X5Q0_9FIRM
MWKYVAILVAFYILQSFMAYRQMNHFKRTILEVKDKGIPGLGVKKSKLGPGKVVVLVSDETGKIIIARMMSGISVFARFREKKEFCGYEIEELYNRDFKSKNERQAIQQALTQIREKLQKKDIAGNTSVPLEVM